VTRAAKNLAPPPPSPASPSRAAHRIWPLEGRTAARMVAAGLKEFHGFVLSTRTKGPSPVFVTNRD
jgi:hypothetical protein